MAKVELSEAIQDYLKELYSLKAAEARHDERARPADGRIGTVGDRDDQEARRARPCRAPAVQGAALTKEGERTAPEVVRHHRLLEQYLAQTLGLSLDAVHAEADRLEHALSEELKRTSTRRSATRPTTRTATRSPTRTSASPRAACAPRDPRDRR